MAKNRTKSTYYPLWIAAALLIPIAVLTSSIKSNANNLGTPPTMATFDGWKGYIKMRSGGGQATTITSQSIMRRDVDVLEVPPSINGTEHWAHLLFRRGANKSPLYPLVQAGTDSEFTEYRFPCQAQGTGGVVIGWGLQQNRNRACERIIAGSSGWRGNRRNAQVAQKLRVRADSKETYISQTDSSAIAVSPSNGLNLIYIHQDLGGTVVDVLVGSVTIKSPAGSTIVNGGIRYTDAADGRRGRTSSIPKEVYSSRPVQIFLDPNHWSEDIRFQIREFQAAVALQESRPIEFPDPTVTIGNPNSSSGVRPGRTPIQPRSQPSTQPSNPPSTRPTSSPQPSAPVQ